MAVDGVSRGKWSMSVGDMGIINSQRTSHKGLHCTVRMLEQKRRSKVKGVQVGK